MKPVFPFLLIFILFCFSCHSPKEIPNVLLIVVDDQGYADMSCTQLADDVQTPNIDRLAASGVRFTQAYATSPICSPSRAGIATGCYQERWGTFWYGGPGIHRQEFPTIAELLAGKGYRTGYIGKVHYGNADADTSNRSFPLNHGFEYFFGHTSARKHYFNHHDQLEAAFQLVKKTYEKDGQSLNQQAMWENFRKVDTVAFSTELLGKKAVEYLQKHKSEKFFLQLSFNAVHNFTHQLPHEYLTEKGLRGYHDWDPSTEDYYEWYQAGRKPNNPEGRAQYLGQLYYLDREVGRVMDYLKESGLDKNTLVIYISDNGGSTPIYANNTPLRGSKYVLYEGGIRVPMIISWPGNFLRGAVNDQVVSSMDILPTICKAVEIPVPQVVDGRDMTALLSGFSTQNTHDTLFWDTGVETAVRAGKWKLRSATKDNHAKYEMVELELGEFLYNLEKDPGETENLIAIYPEVYQKLKAAHIRWRENILSLHPALH
ncbi:MAG: sulfatase-like hydrolase/transferase [Bacteroidia bacterium]